MEKEAKFRCMHCGHEFQAKYDPEHEIERTCPKCSSNSVHLIKK